MGYLEDGLPGIVSSVVRIIPEETENGGLEDDFPKFQGCILEDGLPIGFSNMVFDMIL